MVALREKLTAWLFVLNSCLQASNRGVHGSRPPGGLPGAVLLPQPACLAAGCWAGVRTLHLLFCTFHSFCSQLPALERAGCGDGAMASRQEPPWGAPKPSTGQRSPAGMAPLHLAWCTGVAQQVHLWSLFTLWGQPYRVIPHRTSPTYFVLVEEGQAWGHRTQAPWVAPALVPSPGQQQVAVKAELQHKNKARAGTSCHQGISFHHPIQVPAPDTSSPTCLRQEAGARQLQPRLSPQ